ncbi:acid protease [Panus rudis PR-1116 ss-1]|nr:acid protease [Panus rudis PR-1116 ss-1]
MISEFRDIPFLTTQALHFRLRGTLDSPFVRTLDRREAIQGDLKNSGNLQYYTNITMGGKSASALLDTGSSDLVIAVDIPGAKDTGEETKLGYAIGSAAVKYENHTIPDQALLQDTSGGIHDSIIGIGPSSSSNVGKPLDSQQGDPVLDRIYRQDPQTANFITIMLGRSDDPHNKYPGNLTIGQVLDGFENITSQLKLNVFKVDGGQHWQTLTDPHGILGPDSQPLNLSSRVPVSGKDQLNTIFDTGFSLSQVPKYVADAIYARVPGAKYQNNSGSPNYVIPCDAELNLTFKFGNISFPVHPSDTSFITYYLDKTYPDKPALFPAGTRALIAAFDTAFMELSMNPSYICMLYATYDFLNEPSRKYCQGDVNRRDEFLPKEDIPKYWIEWEDAFRKVGSWLAWAKAVLGLGSKEWEEVLAWGGGRWNRFMQGFEGYLYACEAGNHSIADS